MEVNARLLVFIAFTLIACHARAELNVGRLSEVYVEDFGSEAPDQCRPSDVGLTHAEAKEFFLRSKQVSAKVIHDHYDYAPCYIEGTLKYNSKRCDWEIRAGATGHIVCGRQTWHFACDTCADLFKPKELH
jgi:hypothetical protein